MEGIIQKGGKRSNKPYIIDMECKEIVRLMEKQAPAKYALDWDNVGLLVGRDNKEVKRVMIALDPTLSVIEQAIKNNVDMLITHHPLIFSSIKRVNFNDPVGKKIFLLANNDISYYAAHTNLDVAIMADLAGEMFSLTNTKPLEESFGEALCKVSVFVPVSHAVKVRDAMTREGAGFIGGYSHCTFSVDGKGTFKALDGSEPYVGMLNELTNVEETKIETVVTQEKLDNVIKAMLKVHPYEEVAYDVYKLENKIDERGIGIRGYISNDVTLEQFAALVKEKFEADKIRISGNLKKKIVTVAISPGAGKSVVKHAIKSKVDVLITGDIDHHTALDAAEAGLSIIDAGHFCTEHFVVNYLRDYIQKSIYTSDDDLFASNRKLEILTAQEKEPFTYI